MKYLLFVFLLSGLYAENVSSNKEWLTLLHIKNQKSEIDDKNFFLTPSRNPEDELFALKKELSNNPDIYCKFPARSNFVINYFDIKFQKPVCKKLDEFLNFVKGDSLSLIFPTGYINSPASMYGHTLLRIDKNSSLDLVSTAINYAANSSDTNGLVFAYKGLFGGYTGVYSIVRYYKKINEYSFMEKRDIWEYKLNFTKEETLRALLHIYEVKDTHSKYYFFNRNCSYEILWFLQYARPSLELVKEFNYKSLPIDTIKAINDENLIIKSTYRPSSFKKNLFTFNSIEEQQIAKEFFKTHNLDLLETLSTDDKIKTINLGVARLKQSRSKNELTKKSYISSLLKLLNYRSKIKTISKDINITDTVNPIKTHDSAKVSLGIDNRDEFVFRTSLALHDIYDIDYGFDSGSYISFMDLEFSYKDKFEFNHLNFVNIKSFAYEKIIEKPISWKVALGYRDINKDTNKLVVDTSWGYSFGSSQMYFYLMGSPKIYYGHNLQASIGLDTGIIISNEKNKFGILYTKDIFDDSYIQNELEAFATFKMTKNISFNLKYINTNYEEDSVLGSLIYYFR